MKRYSLSFFKNFESNKTITLNEGIINKLITITRKVSNLPIKLVENNPLTYTFHSSKQIKNDIKYEKIFSQEEKTIIEIKSNLNKLTNDNIVDISKKIIPLINEETFDVVFEISYKNNFYSKTFADMIILICNKNETFNQFIYKKYDLIYELFENVVYVPETNYNEYCDNVKKMEERKSFCCFFSYLCLLEFIESSKMTDFINHLIEKINSFTIEENKKNEVDELLKIQNLYGNGLNISLS
jgi:hypothetical protein